MGQIDRRSFLAVVSGSLATMALGPRAPRTRANRRLDRIGVQLYTIRNAIKTDLDGSLARVASIGYREVELAGYQSHTVAEFKASLDRHGLVAPSTHIAMERVRDELPQVLAEAHTLGHKFVVCPNIPNEKDGLDGYRKAADVLNHAGETAKKSGIQIGYHNHGTELTPIGGIRPYDVMLERTDPALVVMEMDVFWMVDGGGDPLAYFKKYPGRFRMLHVKDMDGSPQKKMVDVGRGVIDWKAIFEADLVAEHYFVEHDAATDPFASIAASYTYLRALEF
ncbi:MAG: sugar phosphate isomerase/epimerase [Gemmatimonadaceae bacterium]